MSTLSAVRVRTPDGTYHEATLHLDPSTGLRGHYRTACGCEGDGAATPILPSTCPRCEQARYARVVGEQWEWRWER